MNYAGLIYDDSRHYLDHLGPFCATLQWPLIVCEPAVAELARRYYPDLEVIETSVWDLQLPPHIVTCDNQPLLQAAFPNQRCKTLWLPHGNSDKGWDGPFFESVGEIALVYGQKMIDFMHAKNALPQMIRVGNFRWSYFLKHREFYLNSISLPQGTKKILYAPSWDDSFWEIFPHLAKHFPSDCHLLVKLHPNTLRKFEAELELLMSRHAHFTFLSEIPPIYPLLSQCNAYMGTLSSVGYDFLTFNRPMYFLNANPHLPLHRCGTPIEPSHFTLHETDSFSTARKALYDYTFDPAPSGKQIQEQIDALCSV